MAVAHRASQSNNGVGVTSLTINKPAGVVSGDVLVAILAHGANTPPTSVTAPSGWTLLQDLGGDADDMRVRVYYKIAGGSEPASYQWSWTGSVNAAGAISAYSGADGTNPVAAHGGGPVASSTTSATAPSVTTPVGGCMIVGLFAGQDNTTNSFTPPSGMTERADVWNASGSEFRVGVETADAIQSLAGASGSKTATINQTSNRTVGVLVALRPPNVAPNAPTLLTPTSGQHVDLSGAVTFTWDHTDPDGDAQAKYAFRRKVGAGAYEYWNATNAAWQASEVFNTSATESVAFPGGAWSNGTTYDWSVRTQDPNALNGPYAADRSVVGEAPPVVAVTGPTGEISNTPTVTWTYTDPNPQRSFQVRIFTQAQYTAGGFDPATSDAHDDSGEILEEPTRAWESIVSYAAGNYRAYVRVSEAGPVYSAWAFSAFSVLIDDPQTPLITVTPEPAAASPRMRIDVEGRDNLLTANQATLSQDTTGWQADANAAIARSTTESLHGNASLRLTASAAGDMRARTLEGASGVAVRAGQQYTALASFRAAATPRSCRVIIRWYDSGGALISTDTGASVSDTTSGWTQATVTATAPANAARAAVVVEVLDAASAEIHYVDQISIARGALTTWKMGGFAGAQSIRVDYSDDSGTTWTQLRSSPATPDANQMATLYDYEAPPNTARQYRARITANGVSGAYTSAASATLSVTRWWLKDPTDSSRNMSIRFSGEEISFASREPQGVFYPLGRGRAVVVSDVTRGEELALRLVLTGEAEWDSFERLRLSRRVLLLQSDMSDQWYVRLGADRRMQILKAQDRIADPVRLVELGAVETDRP